MTMCKIIFFVGLLIISGCERDTVDPVDYAGEGDIRPNQFTLKSETYVLTETDKAEISGINGDGILVKKNAAFLADIKVGSVIVNTASDPGDSIAYFRKVIEIIPLANNTALRTVDATLPEAYSRYIIDSRSNEFIFTRTEIFPVIINCAPAGLSSWIGVTAGCTPNIDGDISFDADSTYFTAQYDETGTIPFKLDMRLKDLQFDLSGTMIFRGDLAVGPTWNLTKLPVPVIVIGSTGLSLYAQPKVEFKLKGGGQVMSPQLSIVSGPHNFSFTYDESKAEPLSYSINPRIVPQVVQTNEWSATGSANAEFQAGADIFMGITGVPDFAKAGFFAFGYGAANAERRGNFTDLQPRVTFLANAGIGAKVFAELSFLNNESESGTTGWINLSSKLESPDLKFDIKKWNPGNLNTCTRYGYVNMYIDDFQNSNQILLDVNCPGCTGSGYFVWVNDIPVDNGASFLYNQSAVITLPPGLELLNTIAIQDEKSYGCYLKDDFLDPNLFNANCTQFTDARDGNTYCSVQIGNQTWMGENLRYSAGQSIGHWYRGQAVADTLLFGRLYSFAEVLGGAQPNEQGGADNRIRGICPAGWHLPSQEEWRILRDQMGGASNAGKNLKIVSDAVWPGASIPASSTFNATSAGEFYPWHAGDTMALSGNQYKQTTFWTNERIQFNNETKKPIVVIINETNMLNIGAASVSQSAGFLGVTSIENIGYSCRCVKN